MKPFSPQLQAMVVLLSKQRKLNKTSKISQIFFNPPENPSGGGMSATTGKGCWLNQWLQI